MCLTPDGPDVVTIVLAANVEGRVGIETTFCLSSFFLFSFVSVLCV
jgi:hypothetical protein